MVATSLSCVLLLAAAAAAPTVATAELPEDWGTLPTMVEVWHGGGTYFTHDESLVVIQDHKAQELTAYELGTGKVRWTAPRFQNGSIFQQHPLDGRRRVYRILGGDPHGKLVVFDFAAGKVAWERTMKAGEFLGGSGGDLVTLRRADDDDVLFLDAATGKARGSVPKDRGTPIGAARGVVYFSAYRDRTQFFEAVEADTGKLLWSRPGQRSSSMGPHVYVEGEDRLWVGERQTVLFEASTGKILQTFKGGQSSRYGSGPPLRSKDGTLMAFQGLGGTGVVARANAEALNLPGQGARVISVDPVVVLVPERDAAELQRLDPKTGQALWRTRFPARAHFGIAAGSLAIVKLQTQGQPNVLAAVELESGRVRWTRADSHRGHRLFGLGPDRVLLAGSDVSVLSLTRTGPPMRAARTLAEVLEEKLDSFLARPPNGLYRAELPWFEAHPELDVRGRLLAHLDALPPEHAARATPLLDPEAHPEDRERLLAGLTALLARAEWGDEEAQTAVALLDASSKAGLPESLWPTLVERVGAHWQAGNAGGLPEDASPEEKRARATSRRWALSLLGIVRRDAPDPSALDALILAGRQIPSEAVQKLAGPDPDGDGLSTPFERLIGTNPRAKDTDRDGVPDGKDPSPLCPPADSTGPEATDAVVAQAALSFTSSGQRFAFATLARRPGFCPSMVAAQGTLLPLDPSAVARLDAHGIPHGSLRIVIATVTQAIEAMEGQGRPMVSEAELATLRRFQTDYGLGDDDIRWVTLHSAAGIRGGATHVIVGRVRGRWRAIGTLQGGRWIS